MKIPFTNSIDSIIADFTLAADKLNKLAAIHDEQATAATARAQKANDEHQAAKAEAKRASQIAAKINNLIS